MKTMSALEAKNALGQFLDAAQRELLDMLAWIAQDSPRNALEFIDALQDEMRKVLEALPQSGRALADGARYIVVSGRVVVYEYRADSDEAIVLHYHAPGRNWR